MPAQLTIDGREVPLEQLQADAAPAPLSAAQHEVLRTMRAAGAIRSVVAGRIMHAHREHGCARSRWEPVNGLGCCRYAAADGRDAMLRLEARGLCRRDRERRIWVPS